MNFYTGLTICVILVILCLVGVIWIEAVRARAALRPQSPRAKVYDDAIMLLGTKGHHRLSFTPKGARGIGKNLPHCVIGAVAACDPEFGYNGGGKRGVYSLDSVIDLKRFSRTHFGMMPEDVNDRQGLPAVIQLLTLARDVEDV